jgi:hypothetical protein
MWQILGAGLQLIGTFIALRALVGIHRDFGQGDLWPAWSNFWRKVGRLLRRPPSVTVTGATAVASAAALAGRISVYPGVPEKPTTEELADFLRERFARVEDEIIGVRDDVAAVRADLGSRIAEVQRETASADARLDQKLVRAMTDRIRAEVGGLCLVVIGTAVSAIG